MINTECKDDPMLQMGTGINNFMTCQCIDGTVLENGNCIESITPSLIPQFGLITQQFNQNQNQNQNQQQSTSNDDDDREEEAEEEDSEEEEFVPKGCIATPDCEA